jgi:ribose 5-phosphate isomerase B
MKWFAGSDHAGYDLKAAMVAVLRGLGDEVDDLGTSNATDSVDYPDFGARVGRAVVAAPGTLGLIVCGTGIGISIAANKVHGVRAARVTEEYSARMAREHNDANVVALGGRVTGLGLAEGILRAFRDTAFAGGRHQRRVDKIEGLE